MRSPSRGTDGPPPCAPQRKERLEPPVPEGEPGMGLDGEGGNRGDDRPLAPGRPLDSRDRHPGPGCLRSAEPAARPARALRGGQLRRAATGSRASVPAPRDGGAAACRGRATNNLPMVTVRAWGQLDPREGLPYPVVVLTHHKPIRDSETIVHINPHLDGVDGAREMCGATTTWLFTLIVDERNWDLAGPALAGAIGDKQAVGGFLGVNAALFAEAVDRKVVAPERRLALRDLPLGRALAVSTDPYFRGLSGRPDAAAAFLQAAGFDPEATVRQLDTTGRRKLASVLAVRLVEQGATPEALDVLVADRFWIEPDQMYAQDLEAYVNSCDRLEQEGLGMAVCLGDREATAKAEKLLEEYTAKVLGYLVSLESAGLFPKKHIQFFYCDDASLAAVVAGTVMQFFFDSSRPTLGLSVLDGVTKVSARGSRAHIASGIDLAVALREAASEVSGNGGGPKPAPPAPVP